MAPILKKRRKKEEECKQTSNNLLLLFFSVPSVKTCKLDSGEIITMGKILKKDGAVCKCRRKHSGLAAVCTPTTVLEKMLKRLKAKLQKKKGQLSEKGIRKLNRRINQLQRQLN